MVRNFQNVFDELKALMKPFEKQLVLKTDQPNRYYLDTHYVRDDGYVVMFGGLEIKKNYVSYHLMPVYAHPELLESISPVLKKRMQGKSCFNFIKMDQEILQELETLTKKGLETFKKANYVK
jgi:hypothetical protein